MNNQNIETNVIDTKEIAKNNLKELIIIEAVKKLENPFINLTVSDVAKDLKMGLNLTNELFKDKNFPSVNIGKEKTVTLLAYLIWKMQKQENIERVKKINE